MTTLDAMQDDLLGGETANDDAEPRTMSLLTGVAKSTPGFGVDGEGVASHPLLDRHKLTVVAVVVVSILVIFAMRWWRGGVPATAGAAQTEARIESALTRLSQPDAMAADDPLSPANVRLLTMDTEAILRAFGADPTQHQVGVDEVRKNPFVMEMPEVDQPVVAAAPPPPQPVEEDPAVARAQERQVLMQAVETMELQSVMMGRDPVAIVDGEFVRRGSSVNGFEVVRIEAQSIILRHGNDGFRLRMSDGKRR